jgi:cation:H+ antiporter
VDLALLLLSFVVILSGAELFTNGIEWFGRKLNLAEGAVGSVLAAIGTALPETTIPLIAIVFAADRASTDVGVGAVLGAPFMLSTLALFVTGVVVLVVARRRTTGDTLKVETATLSYDIRYFASAYAIAIGAAFLPPDLLAVKRLVAVLLIGIYAWYVKGHFEADPDVDAADLAPLRFFHLDRPGRRADPAVPRLRIVSAQVLAAVVLIVIGATVFVGAVERTAAQLGLDGTLLALLVAPLATELPEAMNAIIWVRQGKDTLALGNITGALVFQATIPTVIALVFATRAWAVVPETTLAFASAGLAFLSAAVIFIPMARHGVLRGRALLVGGLFYVAYLALVIGVVSGGAG